VEISTPPVGAVYLLNATVSANYHCADGLSGVSSCAGPVATGETLVTATPGSQTFTVDSRDVAGNTTIAARTYAVQYAFSGFGRPVETGVTNVVKAGRTVPIKYSLTDAAGAVIAELASFVSLRSTAAGCNGSAVDAEVEDTEAAGDTTVRYDPATGEFQYNWKTEKGWAGSCRALELTLSDGTRHRVMFEFR
jgi:hypothetical protein